MTTLPVEDSLLMTRMSGVRRGGKVRIDGGVLNAGATERKPPLPPEAAVGGTTVTLSTPAPVPVGTPDDAPVTCSVRLPWAGIAEVLRVSSSRLGVTPVKVVAVVELLK